MPLLGLHVFGLYQCYEGEAQPPVSPFGLSLTMDEAYLWLLLP